MTGVTYMHEMLVTADYGWLAPVWYGFCIIWGCSILADGLANIGDAMEKTNRLLEKDDD